MPRSVGYEALIPSRKETEPGGWRWGTVIGLAPLTVHLDNDPAGVYLLADSPAGTPRANSRVWCQLVGTGTAKRVIVVSGPEIPPGIVRATADDTLPNDDWLWCDGSAVSRTTYADLFAAIGTTYGAGDGSTTFNLPYLLTKKTVVDSGSPAATIRLTDIFQGNGTGLIDDEWAIRFTIEPSGSAGLGARFLVGTTQQSGTNYSFVRAGMVASGAVNVYSNGITYFYVGYGSPGGRAYGEFRIRRGRAGVPKPVTWTIGIYNGQASNGIITGNGHWGVASSVDGFDLFADSGNCFGWMTAYPVAAGGLNYIIKK